MNKQKKAIKQFQKHIKKEQKDLAYFRSFDFSKPVTYKKYKKLCEIKRSMHFSNNLLVHVLRKTLPEAMFEPSAACLGNIIPFMLHGFNVSIGVNEYPVILIDTNWYQKNCDAIIYLTSDFKSFNNFMKMKVDIETYYNFFICKTDKNIFQKTDFLYPYYKNRSNAFKLFIYCLNKKEIKTQTDKEHISQKLQEYKQQYEMQVIIYLEQIDEMLDAIDKLEEKVLPKIAAFTDHYTFSDILYKDESFMTDGKLDIKKLKQYLKNITESFPYLYDVAKKKREAWKKLA